MHRLARIGTTRSEDVAFWIPFLAAVAVACLVPASADTYWHLRAGQDIAATGHVSLVDRYSYTAAGFEWPDHEWLWQLASYQAHAMGGMPLLTAFAAALVAAALGIAHRLAIGPWWTRAPLFIGAVLLSRIQWAVRPQAFTLLALVVVVTLTARRRFWMLPAIFLLWANVHGAVVLGFVPLAVGLGVAVLRRERRLTLQLLATIAVCGAATLGTPLGLRLYSFIGESVERSRVNAIAEWSATTDAWAPHLPFFIAAAALTIAAVRLWRRLPSFEDQLIVGTALLFVPLAVRAVRNVGPFALLAFPAATRLLAVSTSERLAAFSDSLRRRLEDEGGLSPLAVARRNQRQIIGCALVVLAVVVLGWSHPLELSNWEPVSPQARASIAGCAGQVYNEYNEGGYLIWFVPEKPVFIDGRQDPYPVSFLTNAHALTDNPAARAATFRRYGIRCAALQPESRMLSSLRGAGWHEDYRDSRWVVLSE